MKASSWIFYVLCCNDDTFYAGVTTDIYRRLFEHNTSSRGAKYTKSRRPVKLIYGEYFQSRSLAQKAEHKFKSLTRRQKEYIVNGAHNEYSMEN